jgi:hypothetical protein
MESANLSVVQLNWSNVTDLSQLPIQANTATGGDFWMSMLFMLWIVALLTLLAFGWEVALLASSFICLVIGFFLVYADLVAWQYLMVFAGVLLIMFLYIIWTGNKNQR